MFHAIASCFSALLSMLLGFLVLFRGPRTREVRVFVWLCFVMFVWLFSYGLMEATSDPIRALWFAKIGHSAVIFAPAFYLHFVRYLLDMKEMEPLYRGYYILCVVWLAFLFATDLFIPTVRLQPWGFYPVGGVVMLIEALTLALLAAVCWILFVTGCRRARTRLSFAEYNRLTYCCVAMGVYSLSVLDYLAKFGVPYYPMGFLTNAFFVSVVTYAILVHRLMDISIVVRRSLIYSFLVTVLTVGYFGLIYVVERIFQTTFRYQSTWLSLTAFALTALCFQPLKLGIQRVVDLVVFRAPHEELARRMERLEQEVRETEKLRAISTLAAGMAHEIKNPLTSLKTFTDYLTEKGNDPNFQKKFRRVVTQEVDKIDQIVHRLLAFAKPARPQLESIQVSQVLDEILDFLSAEAVRRQIDVERAYTNAGTI